MKITVGAQPVYGMAECYVSYFEEINGLGYSANLTVWVPWVDSYIEHQKLAREAARLFLERALLAHSSPDP